MPDTRSPFYGPVPHQRGSGRPGRPLAALAVCLTLGVCATVSVAPAWSAKGSKTAASGSGSAGAAAIIAIVNDEAITSHQISERRAITMLGSQREIATYVGKRAQDRWKAIMQNRDRLNNEFKAYAVKRNPKSQAELQALQASFIKDKQRDMLEALKREAQSKIPQPSRTALLDELIDERLMLQEAKRQNAIASDADVDNILRKIAADNKLTLEQYAERLKSMGVTLNAMRARFRARISWNEVIRRKYGRQIEISQRDIDSFVSKESSSAGEDALELQVQRIVIRGASKSTKNQKELAEALATGAQLTSKFRDCKTAGDIIKGVPGATLERLGDRRAGSIPEPTRSMLVNSPDGAMLPPTVGQAGVELWMVCGRKVVKGSEEVEERAKNELRQREFELMARRHLSDLRQDAHIERR